jgi:exopolysaccharide biosynthesis polyprenyl glycosylphosphotransferase
VYSPLRNRRERETPDLDWARLIPGETPVFSSRGRKPVVKGGTSNNAEAIGDHDHLAGKALTLLMPSPLQGSMALAWGRSVAADVALVGLNWLLLGALLVPMHAMFPRARLFVYAEGRPLFLLGIGMLHAALITLMGHVEGLYAAGIDPRAQMRILSKTTIWATTILCSAFALQGAAWAATSLIWIAGLMHCGTLLALRFAGRRQLGSQEHRARSQDSRNVLIVGAGGVGQKIASYLAEHPETGRSVYGILDNHSPIGGVVVGRVSDLARLARTGFVDEVILAAPREQDRNVTLQLLQEARGLRLDVKLVPELFGCPLTGGEFERVADLPLIGLHAERPPAAGLALKRLGDVIVAFLALLILSPALAAIALLIRLDSSGPVFYRALRVGRKGRLFRCHKFRTMVSNADEVKVQLRQNNQRAGPFFKIVNDPRITRVGRFLRRHSLDELPQFWNVVRGEMSLVGPRPHPVDDFAAYEIGHLARLDVTPGITGLWQVTARKDPSFARGMALDREYIRTWSLSTDVRILMKTVLAVIQGSGD